MDSLCENDFNRGCILGNFSLEMADHSELIRQCIVGHFKTWSDLIGKCICDAKSKNIKNQEDPLQLSQFILNSWEGTLLRMRADKNEEPFDNFMNIVFSLILV